MYVRSSLVPIFQPRADLVERRGLGQDDTQPQPIDWGQMIQGFFTQQIGPLPMWAWAGGAFIVWNWLFTPGGSEYREKSRKLREEHTRIKRRSKRVKSGLKAAVR